MPEAPVRNVFNELTGMAGMTLSILARPHGRLRLSSVFPRKAGASQDLKAMTFIIKNNCKKDSPEKLTGESVTVMPEFLLYPYGLMSEASAWTE